MFETDLSVSSFYWLSTSCLQSLATETVWYDKSKYDEAEKSYQMSKAFLLKQSLMENVKTKAEKNSENKITLKCNKKKSENIIEEGKLAINSDAVPIKTKKKKKSANKENYLLDQSPENTIKKSENNPGNHPIEEKESAENNNNEIKEKKKKKKKNNKNLLITDNQEKNEEVAVVIDKKQKHKNKGSSQCTLVSEIAKARQHIKSSLEKMDGITTAPSEIQEKLCSIEKENHELRALVESLKQCCLESQNRIKNLEQRLDILKLPENSTVAAAKATDTKKQNDDDDECDLFGSDSEDDAELEKVKAERLAAYNAKKSKKPALIAKSSVILDVKPWDDETDLKVMEKEIRKIEMEGLLWGAARLAPVAFGINKLCINCVVEDEKVSIDLLTEKIEEIEQYVQSVDVAAFNKI